MSVRTISITTAVLGALALGPVAPAFAADPDVYEAPVVSGTAQVGKTLNATAGKWTGPWGTATGYAWLRCTSTDIDDCIVLDDTNSRSYTLQPADQGRRMRIALYAYRYNDWDWMASNVTATVAAAPTPTPSPTPTATPTRTPTPTPKAPPSATPTPTSTPTPTPAGQTDTPAPTSFTNAVSVPPSPGEVKPATAKSRKARTLRPFPTIRIRGRLTRTGAHIALLTVKAPRGVRITLTCAGRGCPLREVAQITARASALWHIPQFERDLRAGTRLTITVAKPGYVSKVTRVNIRRGKAPTRKDLCRLPDATKLTRCS